MGEQPRLNDKLCLPHCALSQTHLIYLNSSQYFVIRDLFFLLTLHDLRLTNNALVPNRILHTLLFDEHISQFKTVSIMVIIPIEQPQTCVNIILYREPREVLEIHIKKNSSLLILVSYFQYHLNQRLS